MRPSSVSRCVRLATSLGALAWLARASVGAAGVVELAASDGARGDQLGSAVAMSGDTVIAGAWGDDAAAGSAYVFVRQGATWSEQQKLTAADAAAGDFFGGAVAISGDTAIVGAPMDADAGPYSGSAYVFVRSGGAWSAQQKLTASDAAAGDFFGLGVTVAGDVAIVGAPEGRAAYVFARTNGVWSEQQKLTVLDAIGLGIAVATSGDTAIVGATGAAYAFVRSGGSWSQQQELVASDGTAGDRFGTAVALSGDTALVGAWYSVVGGAAAGAGYVFQRSSGTWSEQQKLVAVDAAPVYDEVGLSVAIDGDAAVLGAPSDDDHGELSGAAHLFVRAGSAWFHKAELEAGPVGAHDNLGWSAALSGTTAVVGAIGDTASPGATYVFEIDPTVDQPLRGGRAVIRNGVQASANRIDVSAKQSSLWRPVPGSSTDPTVAGGSIRIEGLDSGEVVTQALPASNWRLLGSPTAAKGFMYADPELDDGPCDRITIKGSGTLKARCRGSGPSILDYDLAPGETAAPVRATLEVGLGTDVEYCTEFGGTMVRDGSDGVSFVAKNAPAPAACD